MKLKTYRVDLLNQEEIALPISHTGKGKELRFYLKTTQKKTISNMTNDEFGEYLAGLIEADGCFTRSYCSISFQRTDFALAVAICERLGLDPEKHVQDGHKDKDQRNYYRFLVYKGSCGPILKATNGYFVAPYKINQIKKWSYDKYLTVPLKNASLLNYTGFWLTGFIEGDGSLSLTVSRGHCCISISQIKLEALQLVASQFDINIFTCSKSRSSKGTLESSIFVSGQAKLRLFFDHFDQFPLQGTKGVKMLFFYEAYKVYVNKEHLTLEGYNLFKLYYDHMLRLKPLDNKTGLCVVGLTNENDIKFEDENNDEKLPDGRPAKKKSKKSQKGRPAKRSSKTTQKKVDTN